jgi:hypothetical protein
MTHRPGCPPWCVAEHGFQTGEEDWLHVSEPLVLTTGVAAQLVMTKDPETGTQDGPYVTLGDSEYTLPAAEELGVELQRIAQAGAGTCDRGASGHAVA